MMIRMVYNNLLITNLSFIIILETTQLPTQKRGNRSSNGAVYDDDDQLHRIIIQTQIKTEKADHTICFHFLHFSDVRIFSDYCTYSPLYIHI